MPNDSPPEWRVVRHFGFHAAVNEPVAYRVESVRLMHQKEAVRLMEAMNGEGSGDA